MKCSRVAGLVHTALFMGVMAMWGIPVGWFQPVPTAIAGAVILVLLLLFFVVVRPPIYARIWRYELFDDELYLQSGLITYRRQSIPLMRVQNVETHQGPAGRLYKVSAVRVSTAGGMAEIPLLDEQVAVELRERIDAHVRALRSRSAGDSNAA